MWLRKNWLEFKKVKILNSCWKKVDLLKFFRAVLLFLTTADAVAIDRCMNFIHFYFFCIEIVFTFLLWWGIFYLDNIKFFFLDVAFSTMITFSTSSDVVTTTTTSLLLPFSLQNKLQFLPWTIFTYFVSLMIFSTLTILFLYHDVAFSTLMLPFLS